MFYKGLAIVPMRPGCPYFRRYYSTGLLGQRAQHLEDITATHVRPVGPGFGIFRQISVLTLSYDLEVNTINFCLASVPIFQEILQHRL